MNKFLLFQKKLMSWGNPDALEELNKHGKDLQWWESFGWKRKESAEKGRNTTQ